MSQVSVRATNLKVLLTLYKHYNVPNIVQNIAVAHFHKSLQPFH